MGVNLEVGGKRKVKPHMNVTPLVDVVLVLLIIFMVIAPLMMKQFWLHVPKKDTTAKADEPSVPDPDDVPIVLTVRDGGTVWINKDQVELADLPVKLERIFAARDEQLLFFDADANVPYGDALHVLDAARGGGAINIAVLTEPVVR